MPGPFLVDVVCSAGKWKKKPRRAISGLVRVVQPPLCNIEIVGFNLSLFLFFVPEENNVVCDHNNLWMYFARGAWIYLDRAPSLHPGFFFKKKGKIHAIRNQELFHFVARDLRSFQLKISGRSNIYAHRESKKTQDLSRGLLSSLTVAGYLKPGVCQESLDLNSNITIAAILLLMIPFIKLFFQGFEIT
jgi:hypothetical protein